MTEIIQVTVRHYVGAIGVDTIPSTTIQTLTNLAVQGLSTKGLIDGGTFELIRPDTHVAFYPEETIGECGIEDGDLLELIATGSNI